MSDLLLPRSGYAAQKRSPGAFAAALVFNGGLVALLLTISTTNFAPIEKGKPIRIIDIRITPPPPPVETVKPPHPKTTQRPINQREDETKPYAGDPIFPGAGGTIETTRDPDPPSGGGTVTQTHTDPPPRMPVLVEARIDPRFGDEFKPDYPPSMRRLEKDGTVVVRVTVDERGRAVALEMVRASDPAFYDATERHALRHWHFTPATRDGVAVRSVLTLTLRFRLEDA